MSNQFKYSNVVKKKALREAQLQTLSLLESVLSETAGPYGHNVMMVQGSNGEEYDNAYTKDGYKTIKRIKLHRPLENHVLREVLNASANIAKTVGDGTTSVVKLFYYIYKRLVELDEKLTDIPTHEILRTFSEVIDEVNNEIVTNAEPFELEDVRKLCMISSNGNKKITDDIYEIYKKHGMNVEISLGLSNGDESIYKTYDGMTLKRGYASPAYINNSEDGKCHIKDAHIYCFKDPIDTPDMGSLLFGIIQSNIINPVKNNTAYKPTVIMAPSISRDYSSLLTNLENLLYSYDKNNMSIKPKIAIITNLNRDIDFYEDLCTLTGSPMLKKYINRDIYQEAVKNGETPTPENVHMDQWCGYAEEVIVSSEESIFINPKNLYMEKDGEKVLSDQYNALVSYLEANLAQAIEDGEGAGVTNVIKRRLSSLKLDYVDYLIGGISPADRDSYKDLAEDAILNCRSAAKYGKGWGCNFSGFMAIHKLFGNYDTESETFNPLKYDIYRLLYESFEESVVNLYKSAYANNIDPMSALEHSIDCGYPINLRTFEFDGSVITSIETDIKILETIEKIVPVMFDTSIALMASPMDNIYVDEEDM